MAVKLNITTKGLMVVDDEGNIVFFAELSVDEQVAMAENVHNPGFWAAFTSAFVSSLVDDEEDAPVEA